jgi:hypothetical protein
VNPASNARAKSVKSSCVGAFVAWFKRESLSPRAREADMAEVLIALEENDAARQAVIEELRGSL